MSWLIYFTLVVLQLCCNFANKKENIMTNLLSEVLSKASLLPQEIQNEIAQQLLQDIDNELKWQKESSLDKLTNLADEAIRDSKELKTSKLGFDEL